MKQHRQVAGRVKTLQVKREGRRWYVVVVTETETVLLPPAGRSVGVDVGVARFLTTSDGEIVANPRFLDAAQRRIVDLQRRKERARPGSGNRRRLRRALAKEWRRVRNQRRDFQRSPPRGSSDPGGGQGGAKGGREQGRVGADADEAPALLAEAAGGGAVAGQQAAGLAVAGGGGPDRVQRLQVARGGDVAGDAQVVAEVAGPDEQHVHAVDGGDGVGLGHGRGRLDLDHADHLAVGAVQRARVEAEAAGPVVGGHAAVAPGRVAKVPHGLGHLLFRSQPGQHDPGRAQVEHPAEPDAGVGLDPDHGGHAVGGRGQHGRADLLLAAAAVLQVEQDPVGPGGGADLGRHRRGHPEEGPDGRLPRGQPGPQPPGVQRRAGRDGADGRHPCHRWRASPCSYSARSSATPGVSDTSAGATSHQTPAPGRSA